MKSWLFLPTEHRKSLLALGVAFCFSMCLYIFGFHGNLSNSTDRTIVSSNNRYVQAQRATVNVQASEGQGSGLIIQRGYRLFVWTAAHVVEGISEVKIRQVIRNDDHKAGEIIFKGIVVWRDATADIALLWLDAPAGYFSSIEFDSTVPPEIGVPVYHVGNWLGQEVMDGSVSVGVVSQIGAQLDGWPWGVLDQANLLIVPGSSGGPIFNGTNNKVIGIAVGAIRSISGIAWYVPVRNIVESAEAHRMLWAVYGNRCPTKESIELLIRLDQSKILSPAVNVISNEPQP